MECDPEIICERCSLVSFLISTNCHTQPHVITTLGKYGLLEQDKVKKPIENQVRAMSSEPYMVLRSHYFIEENQRFSPFHEQCFESIRSLICLIGLFNELGMLGSHYHKLPQVLVFGRVRLSASFLLYKH